MKNYKFLLLTFFTLISQVLIYGQGGYDEMQKVMNTVEKNYSGFKMFEVSTGNSILKF
jgi:hypothetical protein